MNPFYMCEEIALLAISSLAFHHKREQNSYLNDSTTIVLAIADGKGP